MPNLISKTIEEQKERATLQLVRNCVQTGGSEFEGTLFRATQVIDEQTDIIETTSHAILKAVVESIKEHNFLEGDKDISGIEMYRKIRDYVTQLDQTIINNVIEGK